MVDAVVEGVGHNDVSETLQAFCECVDHDGRVVDGPASVAQAKREELEGKGRLAAAEPLR